MAQITYVNKEYLYENGDIPAKNKVQDTDMNQIKSVVNSNETKELLAVTDTAPAQCSTGDMYFNTSTKKIYTATATNTWGTTGVNPTRNTIYLEFATQTAYAYDGTTLVSVGGGSGGGGDSTPIGTVEAYSGSTAPNGYLLCDGSTVSRTTYSDLFSVIGTTYGSGDGSTTFNLPNLKGRTVVMQDTTQTEFDTLGETGGSKELQNHKHTITKEAGLFWSPQSGGTWGLGSGSGVSRSNIETDYEGTGNSGNLQPYIVLNYIIKTNKISQVPTTAEVQNTYSTSQDDTYSCDYINKLNTYSTTEQKVGTWINNKPIYRQVFSFTLGSTVPADYAVANMPSNYEQVTLLYAMANITDGNKTPVPISWNNALDCGIMVQNNRIYIRPTWDAFVNSTGYVILEYTKTTD